MRQTEFEQVIECESDRIQRETDRERQRKRDRDREIHREIGRCMKHRETGERYTNIETFQKHSEKDIIQVERLKQTSIQRDLKRNTSWHNSKFKNVQELLLYG